MLHTHRDPSVALLLLRVVRIQNGRFMSVFSQRTRRVGWICHITEDETEKILQFTVYKCKSAQYKYVKLKLCQIISKEIDGY